MTNEPLFVCPRCGSPVAVAHAAGIVLAVICTTCRRFVDVPGTETADA